jgi:hypothetical protein
VTKLRKFVTQFVKRRADWVELISRVALNLELWMDFQYGMELAIGNIGEL